MGAQTKQVGGGTATATANNWNQFLNQQLQGGMNQATSNAQQPGMQQQGFSQALQGMLGGQGGPDLSGANKALQDYFAKGAGGGMADLTTFGTPTNAQTAQVSGTGRADLSGFGTANTAGMTRDPRTGLPVQGTGMADLTGLRNTSQSNFNLGNAPTSSFTNMLQSMISGGGQSGFSAAQNDPSVALASGMDYGQAYQTLGQDPLMERNRQRAVAEQRARFGAEGAGALGTGAQYAESNLNAELAAQDASLRRQQSMNLMNQNMQERMGAANIGLQNRGQNAQTAIANMQGGLQGAQNMNAFAANAMQAAGQARGQDLSTGLQQMQLGSQQAQFNAAQQNAMTQALQQAQLQNQQLGNQMGQFNAGQQNAMQQAMMNAQLQNQQLGNQFGQFNVGQTNQMNQFNAQQANAMQQAMLQAQLQNQQLGNQFGLGMLGQGLNMNQLAQQGQQNAMNQMFGAFGQTNQLGTPQAQMVTQPSTWGQIGNAALGLGAAYLTGGGSLAGMLGGMGGMFGRGLTPLPKSPGIPMPTFNFGG